ncbi:MAG: type transport system ATP-binding protein [Acidobacteriota bacterium]|jgi:ABC-2 type transport system ATP-binding protein|nr:type transport system ATP-binding protein [Acidobacteriota bacterium]
MATPSPTSAAVRCRGLVKRFDDVVAVAGLDLEIARGECFGLLGPNGAGKTTTIEILEGLTEPDEGEVEVLGTTWQGDGRRLREKLGVSLQETQLNEKLTVAETLRLFRSFYREGRDPEQVMAALALDEKRDARVGKLSGGQKQRLAVACALVGDPELLFLDEPTTGLDPQSRLQLWQQVTAFREKGGTVLLTTHYMDEAERLCDRIAIVDHGKVIALGTPAELIRSLQAADVVELLSEPMLSEEELRRLPGVSDVHRRGPNWALAVHSVTESVPPLLAAVEKAGARLTHLSTHRATLEDLFVSLTGRELRDA